MGTTPIKALFLDFDSTISTPTFLERANMWCVADNLQLFQSMTESEIVANLGGPKRIATLQDLLSALETAGVKLHIISIGMKAAIVPHLRAVGLLRFFADERIWGQDCRELKAVGFVKGRLISQVMQANGWAVGDALFVDDSKEHIDKASPICRTLLVDKSVNGGMSTQEFEAIRQSAGLPSAIQQQQANGS